MAKFLFIRKHEEDEGIEVNAKIYNNKKLKNGTASCTEKTQPVMVGMDNSDLDHFRYCLLPAGAE
jgi:hypothetical protein